MKFGVMFFASSEEALGDDKYHLVLESAKFADEHGFSSVWVPERHFTAFGSLFPNPAILQSALARETRHVRLCAGSVVLPLHNPLRIVEEWSMVDNLSQGRVGISFAPGWNPDDFAFFPERYRQRHQVLFEGIRKVRTLWKGRGFKGNNGVGKVVERRVFPSPVQEDLPIWVTAANSPESFEKAGELGAHLLTYLLDQSVEELAEKLVLYRQARAAHGFDPEAGWVSIMLHTFVGSEAAVVKEQARGPYCQFIKSNIGLFKGLAQSREGNFDFKALSSADLDQFANYLYERFASSRGLIGTPETCTGLVRDLELAGVQEIACLLDFGPTTDQILENLPQLDRLRRLHSGDSQREPTGSSLRRSGLAPRGAEPRVDLTAWPRPAAVSSSGELDSSPEVVPKVVPAAVRRTLGGPLHTEISREDFYARLRRLGVQIEARFRGLEQLWVGEREALGRVVFDRGLEAASGQYQLHPAYLDACLQVFGALLLGEIETTTSSPDARLYLPMGFKSFTAHEALDREVWSHATLSSEFDAKATTYVGEVRIWNGDGRLAATVRGLRLQRVAMSPAELSAPSKPSFDARDWLYELTWQPRPMTASPSTLEPGVWLILADRGGVGQKLAKELIRRGHRPLVVYPALRADGGEESTDPDGVRQIEFDGPEAFHRVLAEGFGTGDLPRRIVHLWALDAPHLNEDDPEDPWTGQKLAVGSALALTRAVLSLETAPDLWFVTCGAQPVRPGEEAVRATQATLWGWARTLPLEVPQLRRGLVDLDPRAEAAASVERLITALERWDDEDQIAFRDTERYVPRLRHQPQLKERVPAFRWDPQGTYLITGGLGSFGLRMGRWMVEHGVEHLLLVGRSAPSASARAEMEQWRELARGEGRELRLATRSVDVSQAVEVDGLFETLARDWPPLRGVVHAAGVAGEQPIESMTFDHLLTMFGPKVFGTLHLLRRAREAELDFFLNISSLSPVWGTKGLAHYAAGNHFLDALAFAGPETGVPIVTLNIGPMDGGGIASSSEEVKNALTRVGLRMMAPTPTLAAVERLLAADLSQKIVADVDWSTFKGIYEATGPSRLLESVGNIAATYDSDASHPAPWFEELAAAREEHRQEWLASQIQTVVAQVMKLRDGELPAKDHGFFDLGMDSLMVLEVKSRLQRALGRDLPATLVFEHPTVEELAAVLLATLYPTAAAVPAPPAKVLPEESSALEDSVAETVKQLSDEELAAFIDEELEAFVS